MQKRGTMTQQVYLVLFELIFIVAIGFLLLQHINTVKNNNLPKADFISKDMSLLIDAMEAAPGNIYYSYLQTANPSAAEFTISTDNHKISVASLSFPFADTKQSPLEFSAQRKDMLFFAKTESSILVQTEHDKLKALASATYLPCDYGKFALAGKQISVNAAGGAEDIASALKEANPFIFLPREQNEIAAIVSFELSQDNNIKAFVNNRQESKALACAIINAILAKYAPLVTGAAVIPVNFENIAQTDPLMALNTEIPAVIVDVGILRGSEIGNVAYAGVQNAIATA
jgi:hypothetical protein